MIIVISPAKTLDLEKNYDNLPMSKPRFLEKSKEIMKELVKYDVNELEKLMKISIKLAKLNKERNENWTTSIKGSKQALTTFKGEVYRGMDVGSLSDSELFYANDHLRILSGLYGALRPFDGINQYRLEMGIKLKLGDNRNLYEFWDNIIVNSLIEDFKKDKSKVLVNLASKEYFKSIEGITKSEDIKVITPIFKELRGDRYKIITMSAKNARGLMSRYIIQNQIDDIEKLKKFNLDGYEFNEDISTDSEIVFTRE
ncbi:peroxide stress protein YaaA [Clostridium sp.]|uniref:peroxide stress protein YaaA n=1 Tax=Clostridium sp. TaxID=1506 RepID=UPI00262F00F4|nr:peroxide stress protein YaaA [Clostridium sp.]